MYHNDYPVIANKYPKTCLVCGHRVQAYEGIAFVNHGWQVAHYECRPDLAADILAEKQKKLSEFKAKEEAKAKQMAETKAEREAILAKLGILFDIEIDVVYQQNAWDDYHEWSYPYTGEGTIDEFKKVLGTSPQSSYAKLRWSEGVKVLSLDVENKLVRVCESVTLS